MKKLMIALIGAIVWVLAIGGVVRADSGGDSSGCDSIDPGAPPTQFE